MSTFAFGTSQGAQLPGDTLGPAIQAGLGEITLDDITTAETFVLSVIVDDSSSISSAGNEDNVRTAFNLIQEALLGSKSAATIVADCWQLNAGRLFPYVALENAPRLDSSNYRAMGCTPLYDRTHSALEALKLKVEEFENGGVAVRGVVVIISDGADYGSRLRARDVRLLAEELLRTEQFLVMAMGIDDGSTDFRAVFDSMGISGKFVMTPGNSASEIRRAAQVISQSAVRASQTAGSFSKVVLGGFGS
ncbi:MAG: hypothetical protein WAT17_02050 [Candidatus Saccharimonadales bacterium]|jgi:hypothetical protein